MATHSELGIEIDQYVEIKLKRFWIHITSKNQTHDLYIHLNEELPSLELYRTLGQALTEKWPNVFKDEVERAKKTTREEG